MSKFAKNYEKALLGGAGLVAVGFAVMGFLKFGAVETDFDKTLAGRGKDDPSIPAAAETVKATNSLAADRKIEPGADAKDRPVDLFTGIPLLAHRDNPNQPVDPREGDPVHPPIPNEWWLKTGADMSFANSPDRDDDGDGFSNREEFEAETSPTDPKSVPSLINKLAYVKDESTMWYVEYGMDIDGKWVPRFTGRMADGKRLTNRANFEEALEPGDTFFKGGDFSNRFKFTGIIEREITSERTQHTQEVRFAQYEDLKENKKGEKYESQQGLPQGELDRAAYYDRTAVLDLRAIGYEGKEFRVEERTRFALPPDAPEKAYFLKSVTPEAIEVEITKDDGTTESVQISKGATR